MHASIYRSYGHRSIASPSWVGNRSLGQSGANGSMHAYVLSCFCVFLPIYQFACICTYVYIHVSSDLYLMTKYPIGRTRSRTFSRDSEYHIDRGAAAHGLRTISLQGEGGGEGGGGGGSEGEGEGDGEADIDDINTTSNKQEYLFCISC